jgi:hypothetical protein
MPLVITRRSARFSADRRYRYLLERHLDVGQGDLFAGWSEEGAGRLVVVMLNPSIADARREDPTMRRVLGFAQRWNVTHVTVVNLCAFVSSSPADLKRVPDPVGPRNDAVLRKAFRDASRILCAWGAQAAPERALQVAGMLQPHSQKTFVLGLTQSGHPRHPLYCPGEIEPRNWDPAALASRLREAAGVPCR